MKKKSEELRPGERIPGQVSLAGSLSAIAKTAVDGDGKHLVPMEHQQSVKERKKMLEEELYQRLLAEQAKGKQAVRQQCEELLLRYQERVR